jgi:hypothetical protein
MIQELAINIVVNKLFQHSWVNLKIYGGKLHRAEGGLQDQKSIATEPNQSWANLKIYGGKLHRAEGGLQDQVYRW